MAQRVKHLPIVWETWVRSLGWADLLEKKMATHSSMLAWKIPWMEAAVHGVAKSWTQLSNFTSRAKNVCVLKNGHQIKGHGIWFMLTIMERNFKEDGKESRWPRKEISDSPYVSDANSCIFHIEWILAAFFFLPAVKYWDFPHLCSFLGKLLGDCFCLSSPKQIWRQGWG